VAARAHAVVELALQMRLDDRTTRIERIRPATSTLDAVQLLTLIRLRLEALRLSAGIVTLRVVATTCPATAHQSRLFPQHARRDPHLADEAIARLRAEFGERSVVRARIGDAHLPAAQFTWEPIERVPLRSSPRVVAVRPLVRRIYTSPSPLPGFRPGESIGPYVVSGGWWGGPPQRGIRRDYYFASSADGNLWWVYYDHRRRHFFLQGCVE
jgi:protein ImuB